MEIIKIGNWTITEEGIEWSGCNAVLPPFCQA
jgi:hypothetical protein